MKHIANLPKEEREILFLNTAQKANMSPGIVEKDFWVCWTLQYLFGQSPWAKHLAFKGGTSLSKCFGLIERFSEDIDVILDWRLLGYSAEESWQERSKTKQDKFNKEMNAKTEEFLAQSVLPQLESDFAQMLTQRFRLFIEESDPQTICFSYPQSFHEAAILPQVRLEIGALAAWTPVELAQISPYIAEYYPQVLQTATIEICTVSAKRTFWEKATILHKEAYRTNANLPSRYSRHYYDLYRMTHSAVKQAALADTALLAEVVRFKSRFYPAGSAHYELATPENLRLLPPEDCLPALMADYDHMKNMLFGDVPSFQEIVDVLRQLEEEIHHIACA